jgi:hypothetical protein
MGMATKSEQLTELQAELAVVKAALTSAMSGGKDVSIDGMRKVSWNLAELRDERARIEKSIQRLLRGGRGIVIDMSAGRPGDSGDPYRSGGEVLL